MNRSLHRLAAAALLGTLSLASHGGVVINELMYHAPDELDDLQYVELHNTGSQPVDLGGWAFTKGIKFTFPPGTRIDGNGFLVVCRDAGLFGQHYQVPVAGTFSSRISRKGERIELSDAAGKPVDAVKFNDKAPWPTGADGHSGSLERICPTAPGDDPANWISSPLTESREKPGGTPGKPNTGYSVSLPPIVASVEFSPQLPAPGEAVTVRAELPGAAAGTRVVLRYRLAGPGYEKEETLVPMEPAGSGRYTATLPGQPAEQLVRFRVEARGTNDAPRFFPAPTEPRPALSVYVPPRIEPAAIPLAWIIHTSAKEKSAADERASRPIREFFGRPPGFNGPPGGPRRGPDPFRPDFSRAATNAGPNAGGPNRGGPPGTGDGPRPFRGRPFGPFGGTPAEPGSFTSAFVYFDPATRKTEFFDFVQINPRKGGSKVHFLRDASLGGMTSIALIYEGEVASLVEPLSYEVYRLSGMPAERSHPVRVWQDGTPRGYHVLVEQPNRAFLRRNQISDEGHMYKLIWYGGDLVGQHEKHTHRRLGHGDLQEVVEGLNKTTGGGQWDYIRQNFDVDEVATYFAVNMVLSHWDGFFNNYFTYHDTGGTGKWMMFPWDQDGTWGLRDANGSVPFHDMALTFGMNGDQPGASRGPWRPPGWFSGPLLANSDFRTVFLARTRKILDTVYTEPVMGPILDRYLQQLTPEVRLRAELWKQDPDQAVERLKKQIDLCREHVRLRREFLLRQPELQATAPGK